MEPFQCWSSSWALTQWIVKLMFSRHEMKCKSKWTPVVILINHKDHYYYLLLMEFICSVLEPWSKTKHLFCFFFWFLMVFWSECDGRVVQINTMESFININDQVYEINFIFSESIKWKTCCPFSHHVVSE